MEEPHLLVILAVLGIIVWRILFGAKRSEDSKSYDFFTFASEPEKDGSVSSAGDQDLSRPLFDRLDNSFFEQDKEDDLTRPFDYLYKTRTETDLFEMDKRDDLNRE